MAVDVHIAGVLEDVLGDLGHQLRLRVEPWQNHHAAEELEHCGFEHQGMGRGGDGKRVFQDFGDEVCVEACVPVGFFEVG